MNDFKPGGIKLQSRRLERHSVLENSPTHAARVQKHSNELQRPRIHASTLKLLAEEVLLNSGEYDRVTERKHDTDAPQILAAIVP